ncbi:pimeloyl-ACP methyl ester carboxylesterase [Gordonia amarae]|nr:hypothetical protein [Gordonia amarae]MCS3876431.1 pimeloyl-ACP methyl ester carboxylesterase [Gordonia amarae]QHN19345.1 hypothetical protein GII35_22335 [Gordonia amarae]QHN23821.1 hypothetical protein GII34_21835 [Gordonia amarae]
MKEEPVRGAILARILSFVPASGDIILIGHSLGSVIAIDLLDHLPEKVHVRRFITLGSPAGSEALHDGSDRILKHFPYARVDDWSNFLDCWDLVTAGRGLTRIFPGAQDFGISGAMKHSAHYYMSCPAIPMLVADIMYPSKEVVASGSGIVLRLDDGAASALLTLKYGHHVANEVDDTKVRERYEDALAILQDNFVQELLVQSEGRQLPPEFAQLSKGRVPTLPHRWDLPEAVSQAVVLAFTNVLDPYEVDVDEARFQAIVGLFLDLGFSRKTGQKVADSAKRARAVGQRPTGSERQDQNFRCSGGDSSPRSGPRRHCHGRSGRGGGCCGGHKRPCRVRARRNVRRTRNARGTLIDRRHGRHLRGNQQRRQPAATGQSHERGDPGRNRVRAQNN